MALCLAESLLESGGFDPVDQLKRYVRWYRTGYLSSAGQCFDIGNSSIMRLAPVPMFFASDPLKILLARDVEEIRRGVLGL